MVKTGGNFTLKGLGTALVTPFRDGDVDYKAFATLVDMQVLGSVDFLVPLGSTGETPCLEDDEKVAITELAASRSGGLPVMVGVGTNSLKHTVRNMRLLEDHGADIFLVVVPYLAETDNIIAIKEASGDLEQIRRIIDGAPEGFTVLSGNDDQTLDIMKSGGAGVVSVVSNIAPALMSELVAAAYDGDYAAADLIDKKLQPLYKECFVESNPIPVKAGLASMGLISNELRLPLVPCRQETYEGMKQIISTLGLGSEE